MLDKDLEAGETSFAEYRVTLQSSKVLFAHQGVPGGTTLNESPQEGVCVIKEKETLRKRSKLYVLTA